MSGSQGEGKIKRKGELAVGDFSLGWCSHPSLNILSRVVFPPETKR
jgi:hypothetical protein